MSGKEIYERAILIDAPSNEDFFAGRGHHKTATALMNAITEFENEDRAIGLEGAWGSGKSSVVEMAQEQLASKTKKGSTSFHFFTFDIWKSQGTTFRRTFLEHFVSWAIFAFSEKKPELKEIEKKIKGKTKHLTTDSNPMLDWYGVTVLIALPFLPIFYFWAKDVFDQSADGTFGTSAPMVCLYVFFGATVLRAFYKYMSASSPRPTFLSSLSRTLLITAKHYENQEITQHIREVDPNDFEFQETLVEILEAIQGPKNKVVLILDNIDRISDDEIDNYWSAVRSIFSKGPSGVPSKGHSEITAIVPYDRAHIVPEVHQNDDVLAKRELLYKTFDEILHVAPPVMSNTRAFFEKRISTALPNFKNSDELFRSYLIFSGFLKTGNGHFTPRQIIAFINELTGLFSMHQGAYALTTIAAFICYREKIESKPSELTDPSFLNAQLRRLAPDVELEQNLAALFFNVDSALALELLLDKRIADAAIQAEQTDLFELSKSLGFALRVGSVIQTYSAEWVSAGVLGNVIKNFAALAEHHPNDASTQIAESLSRTFSEVTKISLDKEEYEPYFTLLDICEKPQISTIVDMILDKTLASVPKGQEAKFSDGKNWINFVSQLTAHLDAENAERLVKKGLSKINLNQSADFVLGCAYHSHNEATSLTDYNSVEVRVFKDDDVKDPLVKLAEEHRKLAFISFSELLKAKVVKASRWQLVAKSIIDELTAGSVLEAEHFADLEKLLILIQQNLTAAELKNLEANTLFENVKFFEGFSAAFSEHETHEGVAHGMFLARELLNGSEMPSLVPVANTPVTPLAKAGFDLFDNRYRGTVLLSDRQLEVVAQHARASGRVTRWVNLGTAGIEHLLVDGVVHQAFSITPLPYITLSTLLSKFKYLENVLESDFDGVLEGLQSRFTAIDFEKVELEDIPLGALSKMASRTKTGYEGFRLAVREKLISVEQDSWIGFFENNSHEVQLLEEMAHISDIEMPKASFRASFQEFVLRVLRGECDSSTTTIGFDTIFETIPKSFHLDLFRQTREALSAVTPDGLSAAALRFPRYLEGVITSGSKVMASEKENVVRHLLSLALEENIRPVLDIFLAFRRQKVSAFISASSKATQDLIDGSLKNFTELCSDHDYGQKISDLIIGPKKTKYLFGNLFFPLNSSDDESK